MQMLTWQPPKARSVASSPTVPCSRLIDGGLYCCGYPIFGILRKPAPALGWKRMKGQQPAERIWYALKETAKCEKGIVTYEQAVKRVRRIIMHEGVGTLPEPALRFYADEYLRMVRER